MKTVSTALELTYKLTRVTQLPNSASSSFN
jgi:hypothetical protein